MRKLHPSEEGMPLLPGRSATSHGEEIATWVEDGDPVDRSLDRLVFTTCDGCRRRHRPGGAALLYVSTDADELGSGHERVQPRCLCRYPGVDV